VTLDRTSTYNTEKLKDHIHSGASVVSINCRSDTKCTFIIHDDGIPLRNWNAAGKDAVDHRSKDPDGQSTSAGRYFATLAGITAGAATATALIVLSFEFETAEAIVSCVSVANVGIAGSVALGAAAVVYFIPWKTFGAWLVNQWSKLVGFLNDIKRFLTSEFC